MEAAVAKVDAKNAPIVEPPAKEGECVRYTIATADGTEDYDVVNVRSRFGLIDSHIRELLRDLCNDLPDEIFAVGWKIVEKQEGDEQHYKIHYQCLKDFLALHILGLP